MAAAVEVRELTCRACEIISADAKARELSTALLESSDERERSRDLEKACSYDAFNMILVYDTPSE